MDVDLDISGKTFDVNGTAGQVTISLWLGPVKVTLTLDQDSAKELGYAIVREAEDA